MQPRLINQTIKRNYKALPELGFIFETIAKRMQDRLNYIKINPECILDLGSGLNIDAALLQQRYAKAQVYQLDINVQLLKKVKVQAKRKLFKQKNYNLICANATNLPLTANTFDLIWSNLMLPYVNNAIEPFLKEIRRGLKLGGCFLISGFGVDTFKELREVGLRTYDFPDMHLLGDILVKLGFTNPVMDMEYITLEYDDFKLLLEEVKILGVGGAISSRSLLTRQDYFDLEHRFSHLTKNGKIPLTLEIFYAHAWKDKINLELSDNQKIIQFIKN